jgi:alpha-galactosidase
VLGTVNQNNQTGPYRWADADFLMTGGAGCDRNETAVRCPGQTEDEYRTEISIWTIAASSMLVSTDLREMSPFMKETLLHTEMIAIHQDSLAKPGGRIGYSVCDNPSSSSPSPSSRPVIGLVGPFLERSSPPTECQVWARPLNGGDVAVGLYNAANTSHSISVNISRIFEGGTGMVVASVRDVWKRQNLGNFTETFTSGAVRAHETKVFRLSRLSRL